MNTIRSRLKLLPLSAMFLVATACGDSIGAQQPNANILYTHIDKCSETVENVNAAFSNLRCEKVGSYDLSISIQQPAYFTVNIEGPLGKASSEFEEISGELPIETGPAIEWHLINGEPRYMIYRVSWGSEDAPFMMNERLILNYVSNDRICTLATVDTKKNTQANVKVRELIKDEFSSVSQCPGSVKAY